MTQITLFDLPRIPDIRSPLGYPGGKKKLIPYLKNLMPKDLTEMISPFIGGGSVELHYAAYGTRVYASDNSEFLINFWNCFASNSSKVVEETLKIFPLHVDDRRHYIKVHLAKDCRSPTGKILNDFERAAIFFCFNKQSFRCWNLSVSTTDMEPRYEPEYFNRWLDWQNKNITFTHSDFVPIIENSNGIFMYLDPPYIGKEHFYGVHKTDRSFDHEHLADLLHKTKSKWIMSYGDHPLSRELYKDFEIIEPKWKYSVNPGSYENVESEELLILNL